jgi:hypothetical protein
MRCKRAASIIRDPVGFPELAWLNLAVMRAFSSVKHAFVRKM